jgi:hypothetical protein
MPGADRREWTTDQDVGQSWGKRVERLNGGYRGFKDLLK